MPVPRRSVAMRSAARSPNSSRVPSGHRTVTFCALDRRSQADMDPRIVAREIAVGGPHVAANRSGADFQRDVGAERVAAVLLEHAEHASSGRAGCTTLCSRNGRLSRFTTTTSIPPSLSMSPNAAARLVATSGCRVPPRGAHLLEARTGKASKQQARLRVRVRCVALRLHAHAAVRLVQVEVPVVVEIARTPRRTA